MELLATGERKPSTGFRADRAIAANRPFREIDVSFVPNGSAVTTAKNVLQ
jgi:hypothetical protein